MLFVFEKVMIKCLATLNYDNKTIAKKCMPSIDFPPLFKLHTTSFSGTRRRYRYPAEWIYSTTSMPWTSSSPWPFPWHPMPPRSATSARYCRTKCDTRLPFALARSQAPRLHLCFRPRRTPPPPSTIRRLTDGTLASGCWASFWPRSSWQWPFGSEAVWVQDRSINLHHRHYVITFGDVHRNRWAWHWDVALG